MKTLFASLVVAATLAAAIAPANAGFSLRNITVQDTSAGYGPRDLPEPVGPAFGPRDIMAPDTAPGHKPWVSTGTDK
jgi:hypothetical protein